MTPWWLRHPDDETPAEPEEDHDTPLPAAGEEVPAATVEETGSTLLENAYLKAKYDVINRELGGKRVVEAARLIGEPIDYFRRRMGAVPSSGKHKPAG